MREKCGFVVTGTDRGFANARGEEIDELRLTLGHQPEGEEQPVRASS